MNYIIKTIIMQVIKVMFVINFIIDIRKFIIGNNILLVIKLLIIITDFIRSISNFISK